MMQESTVVHMWEEEILIPTYGVSEPDVNPLFLERRAYQGSTGKVYPLPVTEKILDSKTDKKYHAVFLENEYLKIMVLPELGGRIQRAYDKTNNYDFVYYNHVIKPALVGLTGPWISGGIEFNWPQHHRPSSFSPVDYLLRENDDGSKTILVGEIDKMYGTKGMAGFTLYSGKAYIEIVGQVFNRTNLPQTFLWWANPAVPVNDYTYSVFPPDVTAVMDHGKRAVSTFPIATGEYYKYDYSAGVDISRYKNIAVPTSYMAHSSVYDFIGNYDERIGAGLLHVADHHISPGKKQWTWGNSDFGQAWDRNLTDEDGPYIELMTGVFTDNQPDFTWLKPHEEKTFTQYFMPYKGVGRVKNATHQAMVDYSMDQGIVKISVYATSLYEHAEIVIQRESETIYSKTVTLSPLEATCLYPELPVDTLVGTKLIVRDASKSTLVEYSPENEVLKPIPEPMPVLLEPQDLKSTEELYLAALHLEQYRHASFSPQDYYLEGLRRDPSDIRLNNGYGLLLFRTGRFEESVGFFKRAIQKQEWRNPNPYHGESYYNLGLALLMQDLNTQAYDAFFKATWSAETQSAAYYHLACLASKKNDYLLGLDHIEKSLKGNWHNMRARLVKAALLRKIGRVDQQFLRDSHAIDGLDMGILHEETLVQGQKETWLKMMRSEINNYLELSLDYARIGFYHDAISVLSHCPVDQPMRYYYQAYFQTCLGNTLEAVNNCQKAEQVCSDYCFPNKLEESTILTHAMQMYQKASFAPYYLGNLLYDAKRYEEAIALWELSIERNPGFAIPYRNLSIAYCNKTKEHDKAYTYIAKACELNPTDPRLLLEYDQLSAMLGVPVQKRLEVLELKLKVTQVRDDLYIEYITLLNCLGEYEKSYQAISNRIFHPWEGGEGKVGNQYMYCLVEMAKTQLASNNPALAIPLLMQALKYPHNLGEGKLPHAQDTIIEYYLGNAFELVGNTEQAKLWWEKAAIGLNEPSEMRYYNDQPSDTIFYQGLACGKLNQPQEASKRFNKLVTYAKKHLFDAVKPDYFAVSLPDTIVYQSDLSEANPIYCSYLLALGFIGLGRIAEAKTELQKIIAKVPDHQGAIRHLAFCTC
jgi:tetratricopeptide (TPR) repeat protein